MTTITSSFERRFFLETLFKILTRDEIKSFIKLQVLEFDSVLSEIVTDPENLDEIYINLIEKENSQFKKLCGMYDKKRDGFNIRDTRSQTFEKSYQYDQVFNKINNIKFNVVKNSNLSRVSQKIISRTEKSNVVLLGLLLNKSLDTKVLEELFYKFSKFYLEYLVDNLYVLDIKNANKILLEKLLEINNSTINQKLAKNSKFSNILEKLFYTKDESFDLGLLENINTKRDIIVELYERYKNSNNILKKILEHNNTPSFLLKEIKDRGDLIKQECYYTFLFIIAKNKNITEKLINELLDIEENYSYTIKSLILSNHSTPLKILKEFSKTNDEYIQFCMLCNPNLDKISIREIYNNTNSEMIRSKIAEHNNFPRDLIEKIVEQGSYPSRRVIAKDRRINVKIIDKLYKDKDRDTRINLANNKNTPKLYLEELFSSDTKIYVLLNSNYYKDRSLVPEEHSDIILKELIEKEFYIPERFLSGLDIKDYPETLIKIFLKKNSSESSRRLIKEKVLCELKNIALDEKNKT